MIKFSINNYECDKWSPREWDKYTNDGISKDYVINYMNQYLGDIIYEVMDINYLTLKKTYIIDVYYLEQKVIRYYISDRDYYIGHFINRNLLTRMVLLDKILE
jgi:hypothetical protein